MTETPRQEFRICTFNVNSIRARRDLLIRWLENRKNDLDILCFQETKVVDAAFPSRAFEQFGFTCSVYGQKGYNGVAICSKVPLQDVRRGFHDAYWDQQKRVLSAKVGNLTLINVYAPHGGVRGTDPFFYKLNWFAKFTTFLKENFSPDEELLIVGDFNVARSDLDVFDVDLAMDGIGLMGEEREAFQAVLDWGFVDAFRHLYPEKRHFTWWDYIGGAIWRNEGMRIDYVLCSQPLVERIKDVAVDLWPRRRRTPTPSDHAPVSVTLKS